MTPPLGRHRAKAEAPGEGEPVPAPRTATPASGGAASAASGRAAAQASGDVAPSACGRAAAQASDGAAPSASDGAAAPSPPPLKRSAREAALLAFEERIAEALRESEASGELRSAPSWGRPQPFSDGYLETPVELRMPYKILKDAGVVPPEVELMQRIGRLRAEIEAAPEAPETAARRMALQEQQQLLALRLEQLRRTGSV